MDRQSYFGDSLRCAVIVIFYSWAKESRSNTLQKIGCQPSLLLMRGLSWVLSITRRSGRRLGRAISSFAAKGLSRKPHCCPISMVRNKRSSRLIICIRVIHGRAVQSAWQLFGGAAHLTGYLISVRHRSCRLCFG